MDIYSVILKINNGWEFFASMDISDPEDPKIVEAALSSVYNDREYDIYERDCSLIVRLNPHISFTFKGHCGVDNHTPDPSVTSAVFNVDGTIIDVTEDIEV